MRELERLSVLLIAVALAGCATSATELGAPATSVAFEPVAPTFSTLTTREAASGDPLEGLVIAVERSDAGYDRRLFEHWIDADGDGCDTRCEVLQAEVRAGLPGLVSGWLSFYDGYATDRAAQLDVDHLVALSEAWRSGADEWTPERRRDFANDLTHEDALVAVTISANQAKSDRDPSEWRPPDQSAWCRWAAATVEVKRAWALTVDPAEADSLRLIMAAC